MDKLNSLADFAAVRQQLQSSERPERATVVIPAGTCGRASGAEDVIAATREAIQTHGLADQVELRVTGCHGFCQMEPSLLVKPRDIFYPAVRPNDVERIVQAAARDEPVEELLFKDPHSGERIERQGDIPFFRKQTRTLLSRNELAAPTDIAGVIAHDGYAALAKALGAGQPAAVLEEVKSSGLRGRGGAGFPTGLKWQMLADQPDGRGKYLVCNADEGDPGAYMDRSLLEGNPHGIIEGMLLGGYATGATEGILYVRNEYPLAVEHLNVAIEQAGAAGLLGRDILGTGFSFDLHLVMGAGAFVCGEETALIRSIEGKMGEPRQRPPFPVQRGVDGKPTVINNVETWANVPHIILNGAREFRRVGTGRSPGTKIFSLVGKVRHTGLVEIPMGMNISEIIEEIGGDSAGRAGLKAVQTGGPSGGAIPVNRFDLPIDYDSLQKAGTIMGSGGMIVMDEHTCMVDLARYFMGFLKDESCGKCFSCRKGTQRMYEILDDISKGHGTPEQLDLLDELALTVKDTAMCGLGQTAPNPVLSTLRYFRDEYLEHIHSRRCPAGVCRDLVTFVITADCVGCGRCVQVCPVDAVRGEKKGRHVIDFDKCIRCGLCRTACKFDAITVS